MRRLSGLLLRPLLTRLSFFYDALSPGFSREQKERFLEKAKAESAFAPMEDVEGNLALFVSKRPDLFGSVDEQVVR